jgi:Phage major capsid protein E
MLLDLFDQIQVTEFVRREYEAIVRGAGGGEDRRTRILPQIMPTTTLNGRHVRIRYQDILGVGLAQFKAPGAAPQLWTHKKNLRERFMEIVDVDEMTRWDPVEMLQIKSPDPNVVAEAQETLAERSTAMAQRNDNRFDWMGWECLKGILVVPYPNAAPVTVNYGIPAAHFKTFTTAWTDVVNSDPIEDLWAQGAVAIPASGIYLSKHHMSFETYRYLQRSQKLNAKLSSYGRDVMIPTEGDVNQLLREGTQIQVTDDGYMAENDTSKKLQKWIINGKIFTTTPDYRYAGRRIAEMKEGWVLVGVPGAEQPVARQGMQSEWIYNRIGQHTLFRQARSGMPLLHAPEAIAWGTAYVPAPGAE